MKSRRKKKGFPPGQTITIDDITAGDYTVAIFGYGNKQVNGEIMDDQLLYYGRSETVTVEPEKETVASVKLNNIIDRTQGITINLKSGVEGVDIGNDNIISYTGGNDVPQIFLNILCNETGEPFREKIERDINSNPITTDSITTFLEPGFTYTCSVDIYKAQSSGGALIFTGSTRTEPLGYDNVNIEIDATFQQLQLQCPLADDVGYNGNSGIYWVLKDGVVQINKAYLEPVLCTINAESPNDTTERTTISDFTVESELSPEKAAKTVGFDNGEGLRPLPFIVKATVGGVEYQARLEFPVLYESVSPTVSAVTAAAKKGTPYNVQDLVKASLPVYYDLDDNIKSDTVHVLFNYPADSAYSVINNGGTVTFAQTGSVTITVTAKVILTANSDSNTILSCSTIKPIAYENTNSDLMPDNFWNSVASNEQIELDKLTVTQDLTFNVTE